MPRPTCHAVGWITVTDAKNPSQSQQAAPVADAANDLPEQVQVRLGKRDRLIADGQDPYPVEVPRTHGLAEIVSSFGRTT